MSPENPATLAAALQFLPLKFQLWIGWMTLVMFIVPAVLIAYRSTRILGLILLATSVVKIAAMETLYANVGLVRLLGLPHVLIWTPVAILLVLFLTRNGRPAPTLPRGAAGIFLATICVSLVFDYADVARYLLGDRASLI